MVSRDLVSRDADPADAVEGTANASAVEEAAPAGHLLVGSVGLVSGSCGSAILAVTTVACRWVEVPYLYTSARDALLHGALEIVCGVALWSLLWALLNAAVGLNRRVPEGARRLVRLGGSVACGFLAGVLVYYFVVRVSARSRVLPPSVWLALLCLGGAAVCTAGVALLSMRVRRSRVVGCVLLGAALAIHLVALQLYVRHYGNLQTILLLVVAALSSLGAALAIGAARLKGAAGRFSGGAFATSVLLIATLGSEPSYSTRRAVLVWGGIAKRTLLSAVWPLCDRDSDGAPGRFWGVDPDDRRSDVTPRTGLDPRAPPAQSLGAAFVSGPHRNLLWIVVDTARRDSFERALSANPDIARGFSSFADHKGYVSCSARTIEVAAQLLGSARCDSRVVAGLRGHSLLDLLRSAGYRDRLVGFVDAGVSFEREELIDDDARIVARAAELLRDAPDGTALFVHLRGGHQPYLAPGRTPRERYENQLEQSLASVAKLVSGAPAERFGVVVLGDHGEAFGEHLSVGHGATLYEELLRTPLLVRGPNVPPGPREERLSCDSVAWLALHAVGLLDREPRPPPAQYAMLDILPAELGHLQGDRLRALRVGSSKVVWSPDLGLWELYDLDADPGELHSVAESRPTELAPLRAKLTALTQDCPAPDRLR